MEDRNNHIDKILREKVNNHLAEPPGAIWEGIKDRLAAGRKKRLLLITRRIAAGVAFIIALGAGYYFLEHHGQEVLQGRQIAVEKTRPNQVKKAAPTGKSGQANNKAMAPGPEIKANPESQLSHTSDSAFTGKKISGRYAGMTDGAANNKSEGKILHRAKGLPAAGQDHAASSNRKAIFSKYFAYSHASGLSPHPSDKIKPRTPKLNASWDLPALEGTESAPGNNHQDKFYLSASFSPVYSYRSLSADNSSVKDYYNSSENPAISYSGGVSMGYKATRRLQFQTGLVYSKLGIEVSSIGAFASSSLDQNERYSDISRSADYLVVSNSIGEVNSASGKMVNAYSISDGNQTDLTSGPGNSPVGSESVYQPLNMSIDQWFHFVEVPLMLRYKIIDRKFGLDILGGMSTNILVANDVILKDNGEKTYLGTTGDVRKMNYSGNIGLGIDIDLSKRLLFTFEPQLKYYLNSFNNHNLITSRPYYIGMYTGIRYEF